MKLDYKKTFLIGFGFFATSVWVIYNNYVPIFLEPLVKNWKIGNWTVGALAVGAIMTIDNIFGVIFQPLFGTISDRTKTRFGKRMPFALIGIPLCAVFFAIIPSVAGALIPLMLSIILFNFIMSTWRSPVVALMPDLTPPSLRSKANGVINMMGGIGSLIALFGGGLIFTLTNKGKTVFNYNWPFWLGSFIMVLAVIVLFFFVREPSTAASPNESRETPEAIKEEPTLGKQEKRSLIFLLFAIFFWFTGYNAIESFFSLFATHFLFDPATHLNLTGGQSSTLLGIFSVSLIITAIPAGILGGKIGRRKTILIGLAGVTAMFILMFFMKNLMALRVILFVSGAFWAFVNINSLPMVVEMAGLSRIGKFTGYYYTFSCSSAIISPILFGWIVSLMNNNYSIMFIYAAIAFVAAIFCISMVRHGEPAPQTIGAIEAVGMQDD